MILNLRHLKRLPKNSKSLLKQQLLKAFTISNLKMENVFSMKKTSIRSKTINFQKKSDKNKKFN